MEVLQLKEYKTNKELIELLISKGVSVEDKNNAIKKNRKVHLL